MSTFSYRHTVDMTGGTRSGCLELNKWYAIDEDGLILTGPCDLKEQVVDLMGSACYAEVTWTTDVGEFGTTHEVYVCTGQQYKDFYDDNMGPTDPFFDPHLRYE